MPAHHDAPLEASVAELAHDHHRRERGLDRLQREPSSALIWCTSGVHHWMTDTTEQAAAS